MAAKLDEFTQFSYLGNPLTNGKIYIGTKGADPKISPITIYSDRELTVALANPQTLDADGRPGNKIWIPGEYSLAVDDSNDVERLSDPDAGVTAEVGVNSLDNVIGADAITAEGNPAITSYVDKQQYIFKAAAVNTAATTINIDGQGIKNIKKNLDQAIVPAEFQQNQIIVLAYNETADVMEWTNHNVKTAHWTKGADIASGATVALLNDGNFHDITGSVTITSITGVAGTPVKLRTIAAPLFTDGANLIVPGGNFQAAAGDTLDGWMLTDSQIIITNINKADGTAAVVPAIADQTVMEAGTDNADQVTPLGVNWHPGAAKAWVKYNQAGPSITVSHNITSVTDSSAGLFIVNIATDFSSADYVVAAITAKAIAGESFLSIQGGVATTAGTTPFESVDSAGNPTDMFSYIVFFGDQ